MSELSTLHPYDPVFVTRFVAAVKGDLAAGELLPNAPAWAEREIDRVRLGYARAGTGSEAGLLCSWTWIHPPGSEVRSGHRHALAPPIPPVRRCRFGADRGAGHADSPRRLRRHHGWGVHAPGADAAVPRVAGAAAGSPGAPHGRGRAGCPGIPGGLARGVGLRRGARTRAV